MKYKKGDTVFEYSNNRFNKRIVVETTKDTFGREYYVFEILGNGHLIKRAEEEVFDTQEDAYQAELKNIDIKAKRDKKILMDHFSHAL